MTSQSALKISSDAGTPFIKSDSPPAASVRNSLWEILIEESVVLKIKAILSQAAEGNLALLIQIDQVSDKVKSAKISLELVRTSRGGSSVSFMVTPKFISITAENQP